MAIPGNYLSPTTESMDPGISGWTTKTNAKVSLGSGGRSGPGLLTLTSVTSGEMQARTVTAYPVTVGQTYQAFADAYATTQPERIGIQWLTTANAEISVSWSLVTDSAPASWRRIAVGAAAPVGAAYARVLLSSMSPSTAGVIHYFENVYLGLPQRYPLNLLSYNAESGGEVDASAWVAESNGTLTRKVPPLEWPADWYYAGGEVPALTVTAAGTASARCIERPAVEAGQEYIAYAYLNGPTATSTSWIELRFFNAAGTLLTQARSTISQTATGWFRQIASGIAPAAAASAEIAFGITGASAGQVVRGDGFTIKIRTTDVLSSIPARNVLPAADSDFDMGVGAWTLTSGPGTIARSSPWGGGLRSAYALSLAAPTAGTTVLTSARYPITGGEQYRFTSNAKAVSGSWQYAATARYYDATNTLIGTDVGGSTTLSSTGVWWLISYSWVTVPANATQVDVTLTLIGANASGQVLIDEIQLYSALPGAEAIVHGEEAMAEVVFRYLDAAKTLTLYRVTPDGARTLVRGPNGLIEQITLVDTQYTVQDYEAPLGVPVSYQSEQRSTTTGAVSGRSSTEPVTVPAPDRTMIWLKDPLEPMRNVLLQARLPLPTFQRPIEQAKNAVLGRRNPVVFSGVRGGEEGDLALFTRDPAERRALDWLLDPGHVLFVQAGPDAGWPDRYLTVAESTNAPDTSDEDLWREWVLPVAEADRPTGGQAGSATRTWNDLLVENATWGDVLARYKTWLDVLLNRPITPGG